MEIPAEFVLANPTLCGEAIVEAWKAESKEIAEWQKWFEKTWNDAFPPNSGQGGGVVWREVYAKAILARLRELGYRRYHIGVDYAAEGTESKSAPPKMAPDAKCPKGHEFEWESAEPVRFTLNGAIGRLCPVCCYACDESAKAAHPPAETPAPDEVEGLAAELHNVEYPACPYGQECSGSKDRARTLARHVLRLVRAARIEELEWATNKSAMTIQNRMAHLQGLRNDGGE